MRLLLFSFLAISGLQLRAQQKNTYYPSGLVQYSYQMKEGVLDGSFISYYDNGFVRAKGSFANGQKSGVWQAWDTSGMLRSKRIYHGNLDFDLISEWNVTGCSLAVEDLKAREKRLREPVGTKENYLYVQRYWKIISPEPANQDLFGDDFNKLLRTGIAGGQLQIFSDDRFVNPVKSTDAIAIVNRIPDEYLLKEQHAYSAANQKMQVSSIGLGLVYKDQAGDKIAWLYFPDLYVALNKSSLPGPSIAGKFSNQSFSTKLDMTTFQSRGTKPRKLEENERMPVILAEIDFETSAWIYLLDKDLLAGK